MADETNKPGGKEGETPPPPAPASSGTDDQGKGSGNAELEKALAKANKEAEKYRHEAKELRTKVESIEGLFKQAFGGGKDPNAAPGDPVQAAKAQADAKARNLLLRSEFTAVAAREGVHDATVAFKAFAGELGDVTVDLEKEEVDRAALTAKVQALKKSHPYFFKGEAPPPASPPGGGAPPPDGNARPAASGSKKAHWQSLRQSGRTAEAQKYFEANRAEIIAEL